MYHATGVDRHRRDAGGPYRLDFFLDRSESEGLAEARSSISHNSFAMANMRMLVRLVLLLVTAHFATALLGRARGFPLRCARPLRAQGDACVGADFEEGDSVDTDELRVAAEQATDEERDACCAATQNAADSGCYCEEAVIRFLRDEGASEEELQDVFGLPSLDPPYGCNIVVSANLDGECKPIYPTDRLRASLGLAPEPAEADD